MSRPYIHTVWLIVPLSLFFLDVSPPYCSLARNLLHSQCLFALFSLIKTQKCSHKGSGCGLSFVNNSGGRDLSTVSVWLVDRAVWISYYIWY